jgi:hypothetical protein
MSEKALRAALGTLVGLVVVYALVLLLRGSSTGATDDNTLARRLQGLEEQAVSNVVIAGPDSRVELQRIDTGWQVNGHPSDSASVARFWSAVADLDVRGLVAANPANHARLGVSADSTWTLTFQLAGGDAVEFLLGKSGPGFSSAYARLPEEPEVYLMEGGLRSAATRRLDDWRDRTVAAVDTSAIWTLTLRRGDAERSLVRSDGGWTVDDAPADSLTVANTLVELNRFQATGFAADTVAFEGDDRRRIVAQGVSGDTLGVIDVVGTGGSFMARSAPSGTIFQVPGWRVDRLVPEPDSLVAMPSPPDESGS